MMNEELLCEAIVEQTAQDYVSASKTLAHSRTKTSKRALKAIKMIDNCKKFLYGDWFRTMYPKLSADYLIRKLDEKVKEELAEEQIHKKTITYKKKSVTKKD